MEACQRPGESPESVWRSFIGAGDAEDDGRRDATKSWVPPILGALARAAHATGLRRLYPFTSMNRPCFSSGPQWWVGNGSVAPVSIELMPSPTYDVRSGDPCGAEPSVVVMTTSVAEEAAQQAVSPPATGVDLTRRTPAARMCRFALYGAIAVADTHRTVRSESVGARPAALALR
jgi:hypothetical protein